MRFFYLLAKNISYTFAMVFFTILGGWVAAGFGYYLGLSFVLTSNPQIITAFSKWYPWSVVAVTLLHYVQFGFLTRIKIPAAFHSLRFINRNIKGDFIRIQQLNDDNLRSLYTYISELPLYNTASAFFYTILSAIFIEGFIYLDSVYTGSMSIEDFMIILKITGIGVMSASVLYVISTYLISEIITGYERANCYNELIKRKIIIPPRSLTGLRFKFSIFVILLVITLLTFAAVFENARYMQGTNIIPIFIFLGFAITAAIFLMIINSNSILMVLNEMRRVSRAISAGSDAKFQILSMDRELAGIEFGLLEMSREISEYRKNIEEQVEQRTYELQGALLGLKEKDDMIQKQLDIASNIQRGILPGKIDDWNELKFAIRYIAMEKIGGDFYDVYQMRGDKLGIIIADVSGHGIPAALVTTMAKISFGNSTQKNESPKKIFQEVNQEIIDNIKMQDYLTCFFIVIDEEYKVIYANASHQKAMIYRKDINSVEYLDTYGLFVGAVEEARFSYEERDTRLQYGDRLILYTDGIPEAINKNRDEYSVERLEKIVMERRELPLEDFANAIIEDVQIFVGNEPVEDDITLIVIDLERDEAVDIIRNSKKLIQEGSINKANEELEKGLNLYPENKNIIYNLAKGYFRTGDFGKVIENIEKYIESDKKNKYAFYIGGAAFYQINDYSQAVNYLEQALLIDANFVNALYALGMAYKRSGDRDKARKNFERVLSLDSENKIARYELLELGKE